MQNIVNALQHAAHAHNKCLQHNGLRMLHAHAARIPSSQEAQRQCLS
jgi:hypothetical protein